MIDVFIRRPVFTTMLVMLLVVFGMSALPGIGIDLFPDVELPLVSVNVTYTGASPTEMESLVSKPIEDAVSSLAGIKTLSSTAREGLSQTTIEFELGTDPKLAANEVREKVAAIRKHLPDQIDEPVIRRYDISAQPIISYSLASDTRSRGEIRKLAEDIVKDELQRIDGVAEVAVYGASLREIHLYVDPNKLEAYGISYQQVLDRVNSQNLNTPGGRVSEKGTELTVRTIGKFQTVDDIKNIIVANQQGRLLRLSDLVTVVDGWSEERTYARTNGTPSVLIAVTRQSGTNTVGVAEKVKKAMEHLQADVLPQDIQATAVLDKSIYIQDNVDDVGVSIVFGGFLAVIITFLFLRNLKATIIGAIAIPTSIISTFFLMKLMGFTLNNMSLMGLSLAVGILIDDAIVVIENIFRHMEMGKSSFQAAREGTTEISLAVMATTFSLLAVFVPVGNMGEIIGQFFKQFGLTVAFAVAFSLLVAFTLTPTLSAHWLQHLERGQKAKGIFSVVQKLLDAWETGFEALRAWYKNILSWAIERPKKIVAIAVLSLFLNVLLVPFLGVEFQPTYDSGEFTVNISAPAGTSIEHMKELVAPVEQQILEMPELQTAALTLGASRQPVYKGSIAIKLVPSDTRHRTMMQIMDELRYQLRDNKNLKISVTSSQGGGKGDPRPVQIGLRGAELSQLNTIGQDIADKIKQIPGTADVELSSEQAEPEVQIKLKPERIGDIGADATAAGTVIQMAFLGITTKNQYNVADSDYDIRVQLRSESRLSIEDVANLRISTGSGTFARLGDVADVKLSSGPTQIDREGRQRQVTIYANTVGTSSGEVISKIKAEVMPNVPLPVGYSYKFVGQAQQMQDSFKEIAKALILAVILIYMVLAAEFESFLHPLTIMLSLPFSLIGAILGLLMSGYTINIMSLIGVIMLMGLVTKNAILLVDYTNQLRAGGMPIKEALITAGSMRLRPILMTTMAMIFGMMPVALGIGAGAELRSSMGVVLVGGLITSTVLTLLVIPLVYLLIDRIQNYFKKDNTGSTSATISR